MGIACHNVNVRNSFCFEHRQCPRGIGPKNAFARFNRATSLKGEHNGRLGKLGVMANSAHFCNRRLQSCPAFLSSCRASLSAKQKTLSSIQVGHRKGECDESDIVSIVLGKVEH
jgi:hypothetical protein